MLDRDDLAARFALNKSLSYDATAAAAQGVEYADALLARLAATATGAPKPDEEPSEDVVRAVAEAAFDARWNGLAALDRESDPASVKSWTLVAKAAIRAYEAHKREAKR